MEQILAMNSGIDKDTNPLYVDSGKGMVVSRKNCRVSPTGGGRTGINTSIKGMQQLPYAFPIDGTNKAIGYVEDKERDRGLFFVYNSIGNHDIYLVKGTTITPLYADADVLSFDSNEVIDADILGDYCVFTSDYNPPRKIDIGVDEDDNQKYLTGKDGYDIQLAVRPPASKPTIEIGSDSSRVVNKLLGKTFQFAYMYVYNDNTYSVLSPYSALAVSSSVFSSDDNTFEDNNVGNYINVSYDLGSSEVKTVKLLAREGNTGSWFIIEAYEKNGEAEYEGRDYVFYNDVARQSLIETEATNLYSDVPRIARTVKVAQNRVVLGNVLKGYDNPDANPVIEYSVDYEEAVVSGAVEDLDYTEMWDDTYYYVEFDIPADSALKENDVVSANFKGFYRGGNVTKTTEFNFEYSFSYRVTESDITNGAQTAVKNNFVADIHAKGIAIITDYTSWYGVNYPDAFPVAQGSIVGDAVRISFIGCRDATYSFNDSEVFPDVFTLETLPSGVSTHKAGSYRNIGVLFYDEFSRTGGVVAPTKVYVPFGGERDYAYANTEDKSWRATISFNVNSGTIGVPDWAKYYRFAITESVNYTGVFPFVSGSNDGEAVYETYIDGHLVLAINMPTNLQYEFVNGDFLLIEQDSGSEITTITKSIIGTRTTIDVVDGDTTSGFWLIVQKGDNDITEYEDTFMTIYRQKDEVSDLVYFESSETFEVANGTMQTLTGDVGGEDAWWVKRKFEWDDGADGTTTTEPTVEDFYINVNDAMRAYSKGRVVVEFDTIGEIRLQDVVWSFNYLDNTTINGISTFNSLNREQLDERDGELQRLELVGFTLKALQDNKETSLYIGKDEISNADGSLSLVKSNDFIGTVRASNDDYGTRYPLSVVQHNRNVYYWDGDKGEVVRSSPNGQVAVSDATMRTEFFAIKDSLGAGDVIAVFDDKNNEYQITFFISGGVRTLCFKEEVDMWSIDDLELTDSSGDGADAYGHIGNQVYSFANGRVWQHETGSAYNVFYGSQKELSIAVVVNTSPTVEKSLNSLKIDSNRAPKVTITSPVTNTNTVGQKSYLYPLTFRSRLGSFVSAVFKNILGAGGVEDINQIHKGSDLCGKYLQIELTDSESTECQIRLLTANYSVNE